jgi:DnaJ-domain-containing protein 1
VHAVHLSPAYSIVGPPAARGEDRLRSLLKLDAWSELHFDSSARPTKWGACPPFHPAAVVRNHVDARGIDADGWRNRVGDGRIQLTQTPHSSCLGNDERPLVAFLSRARTVEEIDGVTVCPRERAARLLGFLDAVAAVSYDWTGVRSPYAALGLADHAPQDDVRRAFRRLALELHPDRHPNASPDEKASMAARFVEVNGAYSRLSRDP